MRVSCPVVRGCDPLVTTDPRLVDKQLLAVAGLSTLMSFLWFCVVVKLPKSMIVLQNILKDILTYFKCS